ncbi:MAG: HAD-IA family hydrolase [Desulfobacterales bacterium]|nr:HAD-IA family hydrolase [Desulfobacterales bacterium]
MNPKDIKAVIFDCDGVMFDTAEANKKFYNELLDYFDKTALTDEQFIKVHMFTVSQALEYLFPEMESLDKVYKRLKGIGYNKFIKYMHMEEGFLELLSQLKNNGYIRGIATNRTNTMEKVLNDNNLADEFDIVVTASDVEFPKPAPDQLIKIINHFNIKKKQILFIGDSEFDEHAASNAGTLFAAFKNPLLKADFYFENMSQIGDLLSINQ